MKTSRVTLRIDDAISAFTALRASIENMDRLLAGTTGGAIQEIAVFRAQQWEAYQRIAKALKLKPTLSQ